MRVRQCPGTEDYRYELTDHLGDARVVFHRPTTLVTTASVELSQAASQEDGQWPGLAQARHYSSAAHQGVTTPSDYVASVAPPWREAAPKARIGRSRWKRGIP